MARLIIATFVFSITASILFHPNVLLAAGKSKPATPALQPKASDRFGAVRGWTLSCTINSDDNDFTFNNDLVLGSGAKGSEKLTRRSSIVARLDLTEFSEGKAFFQWKGKGSVHYEVFQEKDVYLPHLEPGHSIEAGQGSVVTNARLVIDRVHDTYKFYVGKETISGRMTVGGKSYPAKVDVESLVDYFEAPRDLPTDGLSLGGDCSLPVSELLKINPIYNRDTWHVRAPVDGSMTWELVPKGMEILDLEIIPEKAYKEWLPRGDLKDPKIPGNSVKFVASLTAEDGQAVRSKTNQFFFELEKTSSEPGVCMNWPPAGVMPAKSFDLKFPFVANGVFPTEMDGQKAISKPGPFTVVTGEVASYDFGGYGRLKVRAVLDDGRVIYGHLQGDRSRTRILIPYRENESTKVAQKYKDDCQIPGAKDSDDEEKPLGGQGQKGDGLCVYEEYRGFVTGDGSDKPPEFARLDPLKKNLFLLDTRSDKGIDGSDAYQLISQVQIVRVPEDAHQKRVINFNHSGEVPHLCDQHLVLLRTSTASVKQAGGRAFRIVPGTTPAAGYYTPADVEAIEDNTRQTLMLLGEPSASERTEAELEYVRQMFRATGGHYHGGGDETPVHWIMDANGTVRENGKVIKVRIGATEAKSQPLPRTGGFASMLNGRPVSIEVGTQKGAYSGVQDCVMRRHDAMAFVSSSDPSVRYFIAGGTPEGPSVNLCTGATGTGVNAAPHSRYGDAAFGACQYRIRVSDVK